MKSRFNGLAHQLGCPKIVLDHYMPLATGKLEYKLQLVHEQTE